MTWATEAAAGLLDTFRGAFEGEGVIVSVGAIDAAETVIEQDPSDAPSDARFEIGSITKPITAILAALLEEEGVLSLSDPIGRWLDAGANADITVEQLATHTSGLPRLAPNAMTKGADAKNPYAHYTAALAEAALREVTDLDPRRGYSNFAYQLLGMIVERASGSNYPDFVRKRLLEPLKMTSSGVRGTDLGGTELPGFSDGREVPHWDQQLAGPGGVEATMSDLLRFLWACIEPPPDSLGRALTAARQPRTRLDDKREQALGWTVLDGGLVWKNGGTGGFTSSAVFDPAQKRAVAVLVNAGGCELDRALVRTMRGEDPRSARPVPPGPEWEALALALANALVENRFEDVYAGMDEDFQMQVSLKTLRRIWKATTLATGKPGPVTVQCRRRPGAVAAEIKVAYSRRPTRIAVAWRETGELAGFKILRPGEESPF